MTYLPQHSEVKVKISATRITGSVSYDLTLDGQEAGLRDLTYPVEEEQREKMGYYAGMRFMEYKDKASGTLEFKCDLVDSTRALLRKPNYWLYFQHVIKDEDGTTTKFTISGEARTLSANRDEDDDGYIIDYKGNLTKELTYASSN